MPCAWLGSGAEAEGSEVSWVDEAMLDRLDTIAGLLTRIADAVENMDANYDEGGGVIAILNAENVRNVLEEVGTSPSLTPSPPGLRRSAASTAKR